MDISRSIAGRDAEPEARRDADGAAPPRDHQVAAGVAIAIVLTAIAVAPVGHQKAAQIGAFLPTVTAASIVAFALTASLLHEQYRADRYTPSAILSIAYAAAASLLLPFELLYPHVFSRDGLLGAGPQSAAWLNAVWHVLFCSIVVLYVVVERSNHRWMSPRGVRVAGAVVAAFVVGATLVTTLGQALLPRIVVDGAFSPLYSGWVLPIMFGAMAIACLALIAPTRVRTRGHVWLSVVLLALFVETFMTAFESSGMYSYGWYFSRAELAFSATALLMMLQSQYASVAERANSANRRLRARNDQIEAFIALQDAIAAALPARDAVIDVVLRFAQTQTNANGSALEIPIGNEMVCAAARGMLSGTVGMRTMRAGSLSGLCADVCETLVCDDIATDARVDRESCHRFGIGSMIVLPIPGDRAVMSVLLVCSPRTHAFSRSDVQALQLAAKILTSGLLAAQEFGTLQQSEHRYRVLTDAMPQLVGIVDRDLRFVYVNERCRRYTGKTLAELNAAAALTIIHPEDRHVAASVAAAIDETAEFDGELRLARADGVHRWHSLRAVRLEDERSAPARWIFTAIDIEERKIAEAIIAESAARHARSAQDERAVATGLREANRLLTMAEEMAHVGHYRLDLVGGGISCSDEVYRTFGIPAAPSPTLDAILAACDPRDREDVLATMRQTLADGRPFTAAARIRRPDGTTRFVVTSGQVERAADGTIGGIFGVLQDITSIKDAEREREELSERVVLATKAGKIGIWEWDIASGSLEWDSAMYALYGFGLGEIVPTFEVWLAAVHPDDRARTAREIAQALTTTVALDTHFRVVWPSGDIRYLRAMGTYIGEGDRGGARMVGANWDITETRILASDLREEKERAEQANRAKSDFLARMSHEIRTPMNGIIGFTTLVLDGELSSEQRRYVTLLRDAGRSLLAIINDILDFSKLEAGRIELEHIPVNVNALIDGALSFVRSEALPKGIALRVEIAADVPAWVSGDPTRLRQTLLNLLTNALKFTLHGSIGITVRRAPERSDEHLHFEITDTGIGIAPEHRHLLFSDFSQVERSTARRYGGTGLGLAICKRLVEAMGGEIGVHSELDRGSVFWFTAQLPAVAAPQLAALADLPDERIVPSRILVADDNHVNQIVVAALLARDGHDVVVVENGELAVDAVATGHFDLVLMDMQMPVMGGLDAAAAIRALPGERGNVPIIAVTANAMAEEVERCHAAGMNGHLAKPIDRDQLRRAIARWSGAQHPDPVEAIALPAVPTTAAKFTDTRTLGIATLLEIFDGDLAAVSDVFSAALASIDVDLATIDHAFALGENARLLEAAHRMKGTSGSIRSTHIMRLSAVVQDAAKCNPELIDAALIEELRDAIAALRTDLEAFRRIVATVSVTPATGASRT